MDYQPPPPQSSVGLSYEVDCWRPLSLVPTRPSGEVACLSVRKKLLVFKNPGKDQHERVVLQRLVSPDPAISTSASCTKLPQKPSPCARHVASLIPNRMISHKYSMILRVRTDGADAAVPF